MNPGTAGGGGLTQVGDNCLFMIGIHVAHDCKVGNHVVMANNATLGGHVDVGDYAFLGGLSAVHQFVRIGPHAMIGGMTGVEDDVIPFGLVMGDRASALGPQSRRPEAPRLLARGHPRRCAPPTACCSRRRARWRSGSTTSPPSTAITQPVMEIVDFIRSDRRARADLPADSGHMTGQLGILAGGGQLAGARDRGVPRRRARLLRARLRGPDRSGDRRRCAARLGAARRGRRGSASGCARPP